MADPGSGERPPELAEKIFTRLLPERDRGPILGDLSEEYAQRVAQHGPRYARMRYRRQLLASALPALWRRLSRPRLGFSWIDVKLGVRMLGKQPILTGVAGVATAVVLVSALSCASPIRRGLRIQPTEALKEA